MDSKSILITDQPGRGHGEAKEPSGLAWRYLRWAGVVAVTVGMADLLLAWLPPRFGIPEWEFGIATATMENLPLTMVGLTLILAAGMVLNNKKSMMAVGLFMLFLLLVVMAFTLLFVLNVPLALNAVTAEPARTTLVKSMAKTSIQAVVYMIFFGLVGIRTVRHGMKKPKIETRRAAPVTT